MERMKDLLKGLDTIIKKLRVEGEFHDKFQNIVSLASSPFVRGLIKQFIGDFDPSIFDSIFNALLYDRQTADVVETIANIFECFSVDRFVAVETEQEMEDKARELNDKKLFLAGVFFHNQGNGTGRGNGDYAYTLRMDIDNTPVTLENRNRFWFPGPDGSFELQMRYHRGFIQVQHIVDQAIIKTTVQQKNKDLKAYWAGTTTTTTSTTTTSTTTTTTPVTTTTETPEVETTTPSSDIADGEHNEDLVKSPKNEEGESAKPEVDEVLTEPVESPVTVEVVRGNSTKEDALTPFSLDDSLKNHTVTLEDSDLPPEKPSNDEPVVEFPAVSSNSTTPEVIYQGLTKAVNETDPEAVDEFLEFKDDDDDKTKKTTIIKREEQPEEDTTEIKSRKKRSPQLGNDLLGMFLGNSKGAAAKAPQEETYETMEGGYNYNYYKVYTKQIPYPKYRKDTFKTGLYLAQSVQLAFFFALIIQVSSAVRSRIWMRESGNSTVIRTHFSMESSSSYELSHFS